MDNSTDFLLTNSTHARRPPLIVNEKYNLPAPVAEHGFSALVIGLMFVGFIILIIFLFYMMEATTF
jgi:hypothetical protein